MAPNTTGAGDHFRSVELCRRVLELLGGLLRAGGNLVMKVFEGEEYPALLRETGAMFDEVKGFKPQASREVSREMYIIGKGFRGAGGAGGRG
jgi:23S rRNA (uridine2552-2'-O)-methyltransferase